MPNDKGVNARLRAAKMVALFGPPPLLRTENTEVYESFLVELGEDFAPTTVVELMFVYDFVRVSWDILRYERFKTLILERRVLLIRDQQAKRETERAKSAQTSPPEQTEAALESQTKRERADELEMFVFDGVYEID